MSRLASIRVVPDKGFTLVEVLIALILVAFSIGAVMDTISRNSFQMLNMRDRFHANRVVMHVAGEFYLNNPWPKLGKNTGEIDVGAAVWEWEAMVSQTSEKQMRRVEISIYPDAKDAAAKHILFVSNPYDASLF